MPDDEVTDVKMGTREFDLQTSRDASQERKDMQSGFRKEKITLIQSHERTLKSKNWIIYALIAGNLFQGAMLLGQNLDLEATPDGGVKVSTGEVEGTPAVVP